jgi:hypothetical protein
MGQKSAKVQPADMLTRRQGRMPGGTVAQVEESILRMTASLRREQAAEIGRSFGEESDPEVRPLGWWVLVCGEPLDDRSLEARDAARDRLLEEVRACGLVLAENIWVWDEVGLAQLVVSTVPSLKRAERLADHLRGKGLTVRIRREKF